VPEGLSNVRRHTLRVAANSLIDRGWGKAAQLVDVQGEVRQLVEVKLSVVSPALPDPDVLKLEANDIKELEDKTSSLSSSGPKREPGTASLSNSSEGFGSFSGRGRGKFLGGWSLRPSLRNKRNFQLSSSKSCETL
jgi:hypothetical protein